MADKPLPSLPGSSTTGTNRAKLADVARLAAVSLATASRALNQPGIVRPEIRERVRQAVETLNYAPDRMAKALSSGKSHTVGAVVPTLGNAIFADGVESLQDRLGERGYTLLLANSQYDLGRELTQIRAFLEHGVGGLVLVGDLFAPETLPLIRHHGVPLVTTYVRASQQGIPAVGIDNYQAGLKMARYLIGMGHRKFAIVANTAMPNDRSRARLSGMLAALAESGISLPPGSVIETTQPTISHGRRAFASLRVGSPDATAFLCTTDALAVGVLAEAKHTGFRVPDDLSVTGFDNIEIAAEADPPLTTVNVPAVEIGRLAADHLISAIEGVPIPMAAAFDAPLILRDSTGEPNRSAGSALPSGLVPTTRKEPAALIE